jgi:hypothetical protein
MSTERPDLRTIPFAIHEKPGAFISSPASWRGVKRLTVSRDPINHPSPEVDFTDTVFICDTCKKPIGEREPMFLDMSEEATTKEWRHCYFDHCGKVGYTVGLASSYEAAIDELAAKGEKVQKTGRMPEDDYEGGWIWRTRAEAQAKIDNPTIIVEGKSEEWTQGKEFKVYGVLMEGTWDTDVSPEVYADGVHRLWVTSKEVFRLP